jgi:hypothetical protein
MKELQVVCEIWIYAPDKSDCPKRLYQAPRKLQNLTAIENIQVPLL